MSVIQYTNKLTVVEGQSDVLKLHQAKHKVYVYYAGGASGTLTFKMGDQEDELISVATPDGSGGFEATTTGAKVFEISGGGLFGVSGSTISGDITVTVTEVLT